MGKHYIHHFILALTNHRFRRYGSFKGTDETFGRFPELLQRILTETISGIAVECIVFPTFEVRGVFCCLLWSIVS
jgi:hypothetical protein